jgi:hypothetical protein
MSMQEVTAVITRFQDVHPLTRTWPIPFGFVTGRKA